MHASLILLATSLAASVVGAPVPTVSPFESPALMMVRDANSEAISPVLENLKRQILERLDAIVQRSVPDNDDNDATFENDKRDGHSLGVGAAHDKREGGPQGSVNPSAIDKRYPRDQNVGSSGSKRSDAIFQRGAPLGYGGSVYDKRDVTSEHDISTDDQRGGASDDEHASGFDEEVFDKRQSPKGYGESVYDKRGSSKGYAGSVYDKRQSSKGYVGSVHDKRQSSKGYAGSIYDKRQSSKGYAGSIYDKRQSSKGYAGSVYDKRESEE